MNKHIRALGILAAGAGLDPRRAKSLGNLGRYFRERKLFKARGGRIDMDTPILYDYADSAGNLRGQYFHQDLLVASFVHAASPKRHVDIGSRVDGFVAHVAAYREVDVFDIRPMPPSVHTNIRFVQVDMMKVDTNVVGLSDSVSCLHAIEHFGLGRYGDDIDPDGHKRGFANICKLVAPGGMLYMGVPISAANQVQFNANRLFHPMDIFSWTPDIGDFDLVRFDYVDDHGDLHLNGDPASCPVRRDGCGIYSFRRKSA